MGMVGQRPRALPSATAALARMRNRLTTVTLAEAGEVDARRGAGLIETETVGTGIGTAITRVVRTLASGDMGEVGGAATRKAGAATNAGTEIETAIEIEIEIVIAIVIVAEIGTMTAQTPEITKDRPADRGGAVASGKRGKAPPTIDGRAVMMTRTKRVKTVGGRWEVGMGRLRYLGRGRGWRRGIGVGAQNSTRGK